MGDGDVADGEMGKDGGGGTSELLLLSAPHLQPLGWPNGTCPSGQLSILAEIPSGMCPFKQGDSEGPSCSVATSQFWAVPREKIWDEDGFGGAQLCAGAGMGYEIPRAYPALGGRTGMGTATGVWRGGCDGLGHQLCPGWVPTPAWL